MTSPLPPDPSAVTIPRAAAWTSIALRWAAAATLVFLFIGYVAWLAGYAEAAKRIWMPFAWLMRHPPDPTLAILVGALMLTVLFFEPMYRFATRIRVAWGLVAMGEVEGESPQINGEEDQ